MDRHLLLTVEDAFQITGRGVVVVPDFAVPEQWVNHEEDVTIHLPSGEQRKATASFERTHFQISDPTVSVEQRWRVVVTLMALSKDQVPIGASITAPREICEMLNPQGPQRSL